MIYSSVDRLCAGRTHDLRMRAERDVKVERIMRALAAMITQCAPSAHSQSVNVPLHPKPTDHEAALGVGVKVAD